MFKISQNWTVSIAEKDCIYFAQQYDVGVERSFWNIKIDIHKEWRKWD